MWVGRRGLVDMGAGWDGGSEAGGNGKKRVAGRLTFIFSSVWFVDVGIGLDVMIRCCGTLATRVSRMNLMLSHQDLAHCRDR